MKKIGILTFHNADNVGAVLQAFALQKTLIDKFGVDAEIVDYMCEKIESTKHIKKCFSLKDYIKVIPLSLYYFIKRFGFNEFRKSHLRLTNKYTNKNINSVSDRFDTFITGSDQVWNLDCTGDDYTYFLDFVKDVPKFSYAASIGSYKFHGFEEERVAKLLSTFSKISLRENSGRAQLEKLGVSNICVHSDPVTLLSAKEWCEYVGKSIIKDKYVLVYLVVPDVNVTNAAKEYAKKHNCKIINNKKSIEFILHNSPSYFLTWIKNAECVFTNSFHGTAFSMIFNKRLAVDITMTNGSINNRVYDFLEKNESMKCVITKDNLFGAIPNCVTSINNLRKDALCYLEEICR